MKAMDVYNQKYDGDREINSFLRHYEASAGLGHKRYYRRQPVRYQDWLADGANIPFHQDVETEPMVEINIPQHQFRRLVEREAEFQDLIRGNEHANRVLQQHRADERVRDNNPAVAKAWRNYLALLELSRT